MLSLGLLAAGQDFAQTNVCVSGAASNGAVYSAPAAPSFVVRDFPTRCSANVTAVARENTIAFAVGAVSLKGKSRFQGNTGGGAISAAGCANSAVCVAADADSGLAAILNAAT
jgi:hypothetical protein